MFVFGMFCMVFDLFLVYVVVGLCGVKVLLQFGIFYWFFVCCVLVIVFLVMDLLCYIVFDIGVVGGYGDLVGVGQYFECLNCGYQFYVVIGGVRFVV